MTDQASELRKLAVEQNLKPSRVITVTGGKGGVGKSSVALNIAISLSRKGHRVLIIDTDFGFSNIDVMLGVKTRHDLLDVVKQDLDIRDIIEQGLEGVQFISGGSGVYELTQLDGNELMHIVNNLKNLEDVADTVIFDTGAGVSDNILRLVYASHDTLVVTTPEPTAVVDAYALIKIIGEQGKSAGVRLIINKADNPSEAASVMDCIVRIAKKNLDVHVDKLGCIMRDVNMQKAIRMQVPILVSFPNCTASSNINGIASKLIKTSETEPERPGIRSFLDRFLAKNSNYPG
jgi:flagellar biosynthesis protein FlhG